MKNRGFCLVHFHFSRFSIPEIKTNLGTYRVAEVQAPKNFYNKGETKDVAITYAGQMVEAVFSDTTFLNDRQKAEVHVVKCLE